MQPRNQTVGPFALSKMEVDECYVRWMLIKQALGLSHSRCWSGHLRSQELKVLLHRFSDIPRIFDQEDI